MQQSYTAVMGGDLHIYILVTSHVVYIAQHGKLCCRWLDHTIWKIISMGGATGGDVREHYLATSGLISRPVEQMEELILA